MGWRRKRLTANQQALRTYKQQAPLSIGALLATERDHRLAQETRVRDAVREVVWASRPWCQLCHGRRGLECMGLPDELHEHPSRAATRNLPPIDRFNLVVCGRVCAACHRDLTEHRLEVVFADVRLGFMGRVWGVPAEPKEGPYGR